MVDTILQRLHEQRDTRVVAIRSAKLPINVLLAHWHHVRTTDTVIVLLTQNFSRFLSPFTHQPFLSWEKSTAIVCVGTYRHILRKYALETSITLTIHNFAPVNSDTISCTRLAKAKFYSFDHFAFLPPLLTRSKLAQVPVKNLIKTVCVSQLRGTYGGDTFNVGRKFRLWYISAVREPLAAVCVESNTLFRFRGQQTVWSYCSYVRSTWWRYARTARYVSVS